MKKSKISKTMSELAKHMWKNTPKWKRKLHSRKMNEAKRRKKLLTQAELKRLRKEVERV